MADYAHEWTEEELASLETRIFGVYQEAYHGLTESIEKYFLSFEEKDKIMRQKLETGEITQDEYTSWRLAAMTRTERFEALRDLMAERMTAANEVAIAYVNDATPGIYSLNRNYMAYTFEKAVGVGASFTLFDEATVKRLIVENPDLMPNYPAEKAVKRGIDLAWGKKQITASVTSGILQGKSIPNIAKDLQKRIVDMDRSAAIRAARTATTGAQNAGRLDSSLAARKMGIEHSLRWVALKDGRTRHSHRRLDGEMVEPGEKFSNGCRYPGDPRGKPEDTYNCRCTMKRVVKGVREAEPHKMRVRDPETGEYALVNQMTYQEWAEWKQSENQTAWDLYMKKGKSLSSDKKQWQEYKKVLGKNVPGTLDSFQNMKYSEPEKWAQLKTDKRQTDLVNNASCVTTPKKFSGYFLKPGAKHADQFFNVGYTEKDVLQLRYDIARQFSTEKAVEFRQRADGAVTFNVYMELGTTKKRSFCTGWIQDKPNATPRIVTAFRKNKEDSNDK